jgi:mannose-6-phosphate isomerase-like protein (cupin superfamily)
MKQVEKISEGSNYTAINIGDLEDVKSYSLIHPISGREIKGKVFVKEPTNATGAEISFTTFPPKSEWGYFHIHHKNEETYIILKGSGYYQVDDDCFPIKAGSIIRVAPKGVRSLCNTSEEEMIMICIQSKENSLEEYTTDDGQRVEFLPKWKII